MPSKKSTVWNTKKNKGWEKYKEKTDMNGKLLSIANSSDDNPESILKEMDKELTKVKFSTFGKIKVYSKPKKERELDHLQEQKIKLSNKLPSKKISDEIEVLNTKMSIVLDNLKSAKHEKEIKQLENMKKSKGKSAATFHLKNKIVGSKKTTPDQVVIIDPSTRKEVYDTEEIKRVSLKYCIDLLTDKKPKEEYAEIFKEKKISY